MLDLLEKPNVILIEGNHEEKSVKKFIYDEEKIYKIFWRNNFATSFKRIWCELCKGFFKENI